MKYMQAALNKVSGSIKLPMNILADTTHYAGPDHARSDRFVQRLDALSKDKARSLPERHFFKH